MAATDTTRELLGEERRELILRWLGAEGKVRASDLALRLRVSLDTVRRDLQELADAGLLRRVHGGALPPSPPGPDSFVERLPDDVAAKAAVAQAAVGLIRPGEVIAISGGTTTLEFARRLPDDLDATVIATNPHIAVALADHPRADRRRRRRPAAPRRAHRRRPRGGRRAAPRAPRRLRAQRLLAAPAGRHDAAPSRGGARRPRDGRGRRRGCSASPPRASSARAGPYPVAGIERIDTLVTDAPDDDVQVYRDARHRGGARVSGTPKQARAAVTAIFLLNGLIFGAWAARIPAVRDRRRPLRRRARHRARLRRRRLDPRHADRRRRAPRASAAAAPRASPSRSCAWRPASSRWRRACRSCARSRFFYGASMGSLDVTMNAHGVAVERRYGAPDPGQLPRRVLDRRARRRRARRARARPSASTCACSSRSSAVASAAVGLTWSRRFLAADDDAMAAAPSRSSCARRGALLALGALAFACLLIEGASADWSAVYLRDELGTTAGVAAIGFTAVQRHDDPRADLRRPAGRPLRPGGRRARRRQHRRGRLRPRPRRGRAGAPRSPASRAWAPGCRASCRSSSAPRARCPACPPASGWPRSRARATSGFLVGPPTIGGLAELIGLPAALGVLVVLAAAVALLAPTTRYARGGSAVVREPQSVAA